MTQPTHRTIKLSKIDNIGEIAEEEEHEEIREVFHTKDMDRLEITVSHPNGSSTTYRIIGRPLTIILAVVLGVGTALYFLL